MSIGDLALQIVDPFAPSASIFVSLMLVLLIFVVAFFIQPYMGDDWFRFYERLFQSSVPRAPLRTAASEIGLPAVSQPVGFARPLPPPIPPALLARPLPFPSPLGMIPLLMGGPLMQASLFRPLVVAYPPVRVR